MPNLTIHEIDVLLAAYTEFPRTAVSCAAEDELLDMRLLAGSEMWAPK